MTQSLVVSNVTSDNTITTMTCTLETCRRGVQTNAPGQMSPPDKSP